MVNKIMELTGSKQKILEAAKLEFAKFGFEGARVDRIARTSKINKAMIYYYFHSKEELYRAVFELFIGRIFDFIEKADIDESNLEDFLLRLSELYNQQIGAQPEFSPLFLWELAGGGARVKEALERLLRREGFFVKMKSLIEKGIREGRFREIDSRQAMISFMGMNLFYLLMVPIAGKSWGIEDEEESFRNRRPKEIVELFLYGIKKH